jgi:hypothetical protein
VGVDGIPVRGVGPGRLDDCLPAAVHVGEDLQPVGCDDIGVVDPGLAGGVVVKGRPGCCAAPLLVMGAAVPLVMRAGRPGGMAVGVVVIGSGCGGAHGLDGGCGPRVGVVGCG